jgi:hypothetical protein
MPVLWHYFFMKSVETSSLAETQESICVEIADEVKTRMVKSKSLLHASNTTVWGHTDYYWLYPFTPQASPIEYGAQWMARITGLDSDLKVKSLDLVKIPIDESGVPQFPRSSFSWDIAYSISGSGACVSSPAANSRHIDKLLSSDSEINAESITNVLQKKPDDEELTICRIILEDVLLSLTQAS